MRSDHERSGLRPPPVPLNHRLFHMVGRARGALMLRAFERDARNARAVNAAALRRILSANRDCEAGRKLGFATLERDPAAYRRAVPLQRWTDVAPAIDRMARGERGVLCTEPVIFFSVTSGTTGASKRIPATARSFAWQRRYYTGLNPAVPATKLPNGGDPHPGIILLNTSGVAQRTEGGIPVAAASANGLSRVKRLAPFLWSSPWTVFEVPDMQACWYLHALFGLRARNIKFLNAVFAPHLLSWLGIVEERWTSLMRAIADGRVPEEISLSKAHRNALDALLRPDPDRAAELEQAAEHGFAGFARRVWPWIRYASTVITGPFATALPRLRHYLGDLPIHTTCLSASEGMLGLNLEIDRPDRYVLSNGSAHFEFIPLDRAHEEQPPTVPLEELSVGSSYELVLSNDAGLYRYRLGDVLDVVDFHHEAPVLVFRYRKGSILDLVGEKTSEEQALAAVRQAVGDDALVDYAAWPDTQSMPPRYVFYIEVSGEQPRPADLARRLDDALCAANPEYAGCRVEHGGGDAVEIVAPLGIRLLRPGTFAAFERLRAERNPEVGRNQLKPAHLLKDESLRQFLDSSTAAF